MKRFKIEKNHNLNQMWVTLHEGPYTPDRILNKTGWKSEDVTITEVKMYEGEEYCNHKHQI